MAARLRRFLLLLALVPAAALAAPHAGDPAPPLTARTLAGERFDLHAERGQVVLIHFWATWCAPCRLEMPALDAYYRAHQAQGLRVLAISLDDPAELDGVRAIMANFAFPAAMAAEAAYRGYGRVWRMPLTFVVDRAGILRGDGTEADPRLDAERLERRISPLLAPLPARAP